MATYVVSDLHGLYATFMEGLRVIDFREEDRLFVLGDAIDRGPDGIAILMEVKDRENMDLIIGNHEHMMLNSVSLDGKDKCNGRDSELWRFHNGGRVTYEKYLDLSVKKRKELLDWLLDRMVIKTVEAEGAKYCLTHSHYLPEYENVPYWKMDYDAVYEIVWKSVFRRDSTWTHAVYQDYPQYTFITGHVPVQRAFQRSLEEVMKLGVDGIKRANFINVDGGCAMGTQPVGVNGALFLRLEDQKLFGIPTDLSAK